MPSKRILNANVITPLNLVVAVADEATELFEAQTQMLAHFAGSAERDADILHFFLEWLDVIMWAPVYCDRAHGDYAREVQHYFKRAIELHEQRQIERGRQVSPRQSEFYKAILAAVHPAVSNNTTPSSVLGQAGV